MSESARSLEAGNNFLTHKKSAPSAQWAPKTHVGGDAFPRSRMQFPCP
ncbi:MAG: hypothetical protein FWF77_09365 [Defluviitaleaceae bacterium]|nr:hypothetical protein [Defluviitaleaceae bacterium]